MKKYLVAAEKETYTFNELPKSIQEKVIESFRNADDFLDGDWWYEGEVELLQEELAKKGIEDAKVSFIISYSQGDGAGVVDFDLNLKQAMKAFDVQCYEEFEEYFENSAYIEYYKTRTRNYQDSRVDVTYSPYALDYFFEDDEEFKDIVKKYWKTEEEMTDYFDEVAYQITKRVNEYLDNKMKEFYQELRDTYEGYFTDEAITEFIEMNEYKFDVNGDRV